MNQLKTGTKIEMEHKLGKVKATQIAKQHIAEYPNYYTGLTQMEKCMKEGKKKCVLRL